MYLSIAAHMQVYLLLQVCTLTLQRYYKEFGSVGVPYLASGAQLLGLLHWSSDREFSTIGRQRWNAT